MTHHNELDQLLDDALAEYREAEPLAGLEDRVFQRLQWQTARQRRLWWRWSAIAAAAAALVMAAWIGLGHRTRPEVAPRLAAGNAAPVEPPQPSGTLKSGQPVAKPVAVAKPVSHIASVHSPAKLVADNPVPKAESFPSPAPLKAEERTLLALAKTHPELLTKDSDADKEIVINPINIKPLADETGSSQGEN